jgi:hypothetical protein
MKRRYLKQKPRAARMIAEPFQHRFSLSGNRAWKRQINSMRKPKTDE